MGCSTGRTVERDKINNNGYPICRLSIPLQMEVGSLSALNNDKLILGAKEELQCFDCISKSITPISKEHKGRINCIIKLSNGNIATGSQDNTIKIWDIEKKEVLYTLNGHTSIIWDIRELEGNKIISASDDNISKVWEFNEKKKEYESYDLCNSHRHISSVAVLKNNKVILATGKNLFLYDLKTKKQESFLDIPKGGVWVVRELSNGDVAVGLGNGLLYILKITDELIIKTKFAQGHKRTARSCVRWRNSRPLNPPKGWPRPDK
jgi:WD40 repeat protein